MSWKPLAVDTPNLPALTLFRDRYSIFYWGSTSASPMVFSRVRLRKCTSMRSDIAVTATVSTRSTTLVDPRPHRSGCFWYLYLVASCILALCLPSRDTRDGIGCCRNLGAMREFHDSRLELLDISQGIGVVSKSKYNTLLLYDAILRGKLVGERLSVLSAQPLPMLTFETIDWSSSLV